MKKFLKRLHDFFFPPAGSPTWVRLLPYALLEVLILIYLTGSGYAWEYTNSPKFCGTTCHTMPPEYTAYLVSPHARVDCVDCHIGKGFIATASPAKPAIYDTSSRRSFVDYEFPIRAWRSAPGPRDLRDMPLPEKFSDDSLREINSFTNDTETPPLTYLVLKTGGGSERQGLGKGIHWHIQNKVYYLPDGSEEQQIPYVHVVKDDGSSTEYVDIKSG